jgi:6-hydroxy-3-succinoylpyridine 3-monooxygenase
MPNQIDYLRALATTSLVDVVLGKFKNKTIFCKFPTCTQTGKRPFEVPEEKRTDVNIAVYMLDDAYQNACDNVVLVSGDSDLVPAVRMIRTRFPNKQITVYVPTQNPTRGAAVELRSSAHKNRDLPLNLLSRAQFPATLQDGAGGLISKPSAW